MNSLMVCGIVAVMVACVVANHAESWVSRNDHFGGSYGYAFGGAGNQFGRFNGANGGFGGAGGLGAGGFGGAGIATGYVGGGIGGIGGGGIGGGGGGAGDYYHHYDAGKDYYAYPKYKFDYGVKDFKTGDNKDAWETRDGDVVKGGYSLYEPDGTKRVVEYVADKHHGFNAVVKKIGHAHHPQHYGINGGGIGAGVGGGVGGNIGGGFY